MRASLVRDLSDRAPALLDPAALPAATPEPEILFETATVRARRLHAGGVDEIAVGGCRVETDVRTGPAAKLRFRLIAVPAA